MLLVAGPEYGLLSSDQNYVEINITTSNGLPGPHRRLGESELISCSAGLKRLFNQMVLESCVPNFFCKAPTTSFITSARFGRGYLAILLPCNVVQEAESSSNSILLFNLIVTRLDESITEIVDGFNKDKEPGDERYWSELSASLAILYFGLLEAQEGLKNHSIRRFCGGAELADRVANRIELTLEHLNLLLCHQYLECDPEWFAILNGSLEDLRASVKISSLSIRTVKQADLMTTRSLSASSYESASICSTDTPLSSVKAIHPGDHDNRVGTGWDEPGPGPYSTPFAKLLAPPWDQSLFNLAAPLPTTTLDQNPSSPCPAFSYGNVNMEASPSSFLTIYTPYFNSFSGSPLEHFPKDNGSSDITSPESFPNCQALGMFSDVPSEIEQIHSHVSLPSSHTSDLGKETSDLDSRDLFPDPHYPYTFTG
ncbi:hypothetical protein BGZ57DRAFT_867744 [Hyaloscypha finlandica]|nr:hypothetical protein BGZ57DRAFT_867744 [Hyaloscypha finlandica]